MEEKTIASIDVGTTMTDLKLRVVEHILARYDGYGTNDVQNILNETKVGAWRKPTLLKMLKMVFSAS